MSVETFALQDFSLERGGRLSPAQIVYSTYGRLSEAGTNAILFPTAFGGRHEDNEWLIGPGQPLDTNQYYIVVPNLIGNGVSSSPSNYGAPFPSVTIRDNVFLQKRLLEHLGVQRIVLAIGYSMGGQQVYQWATSYPDMVVRLACICSSASTTPWQKAFLQGMRAVLNLYDYSIEAAQESRVIEALARVWAPWGLSATFYDDGRYRTLGYDTQTKFIQAYWVDRISKFSVGDLRLMLDTWDSHELGRTSEGISTEEVLSQIRCPTLLMPSVSDKYFNNSYAASESRFIPEAHVVELNSEWGHVAGRGLADQDALTIRAALRSHLTMDGPE